LLSCLRVVVAAQWL